MIDQDLIAYVVSLATAAEARVYLGNAPQNTPLPLVVVRRIGGGQPRSLNNTPLFERSQFSVNVLADNYADSYPIANAIRDALKGFRGMMVTTPVESSQCTLFPIDQSEIDGDKVTRWVASNYSFMHA